MASNKESEKLKILCIHGYRQSGQAFRERTGAFRKIIKKYADLVFIDAPNTVPPLEDSGDAANSNQLGWWFSRRDDYFHAQEPSECVKGYEESLQVIKAAFRDEGPFDGVIGFSQGASMVSLMCGLQQQNLDAELNFKFAILVAGFKSRSQPHDKLYDVPIDIPTLHVYGETDKVIEQEMSVALLQYFNEPITLQHSGGHFVPASSPQKTVYQKFLQDMLDRKQSEQTPS